MKGVFENSLDYSKSEVRKRYNRSGKINRIIYRKRILFYHKTAKKERNKKWNLN